MQNWSGHHTFSAARIHRPTSTAELQRIVATATHCKVLGSAHSFNDIADTDADLIILDQLTTPPVLDMTTGTVTVTGGMRYGELAYFWQTHAGPCTTWRRSRIFRSLAPSPLPPMARACATAILRLPSWG